MDWGKKLHLIAKALYSREFSSVGDMESVISENGLAIPWDEGALCSGVLADNCVVLRKQMAGLGERLRVYVVTPIGTVHRIVAAGTHEGSVESLVAFVESDEFRKNKLRYLRQNPLPLYAYPQAAEVLGDDDPMARVVRQFEQLMKTVVESQSPFGD